jgi:hypothetical protein
VGSLGTVGSGVIVAGCKMNQLYAYMYVGYRGAVLATV